MIVISNQLQDASVQFFPHPCNPSLEIGIVGPKAWRFGPPRFRPPAVFRFEVANGRLAMLSETSRLAGSRRQHRVRVLLSGIHSCHKTVRIDPEFPLGISRSA